jgi:hypothetical protein
MGGKECFRVFTKKKKVRNSKYFYGNFILSQIHITHDNDVADLLGFTKSNFYSLLRLLASSPFKSEMICENTAKWLRLHGNVPSKVDAWKETKGQKSKQNLGKNYASFGSDSHILFRYHSLTTRGCLQKLEKKTNLHTVFNYLYV